jgi:2-phospho-L-lactate guanylyltransferase (CobY/MobA/RfbA family)
MSEIAVLIMAGTKPGTPNRALWKIHNKTMLEHVLVAVQTALPDVQILVAGEDIPTPKGITKVAGGKTRVETLLNGVGALDNAQDTRLLVVTADIPFLTPEAITDFVNHAPDADFTYAIVPMEVCKKRFPTLKRTTLRLSEGTYTGGNLVFVRPAFLQESAQAVLQAEARRKSVIGLAQMLGGGTLIRYLASFVQPKVLTLSYLEAQVSKAIGGAAVKVYISNYAEVGTDIDCEDERKLAETLLSA